MGRVFDVVAGVVLRQGMAVGADRMMLEGKRRHKQPWRGSWMARAFGRGDKTKAMIETRRHADACATPVTTHRRLGQIGERG